MWNIWELFVICYWFSVKSEAVLKNKVFFKIQLEKYVGNVYKVFSTIPTIHWNPVVYLTLAIVDSKKQSLLFYRVARKKNCCKLNYDTMP